MEQWEVSYQWQFSFPSGLFSVLGSLATKIVMQELVARKGTSCELAEKTYLNLDLHN